MFQEIYAKFSIDPSVTIVIQLFKEVWQEYVDVHRDDKIIAGKKYRVVLDTPKVLYVENSLHNCEESESNLSSSLPESLATYDCNTSGSYEISETHVFPADASEPDFFAANVSQSRLSLLDFTIPSQDFSSRLREALNDQIPLSRVLRSEFIHTICSKIWRISKYPTSIMFTDVARTIILQYPYLTENLGTGYGGWRQAIRDKFKNMRRLDLSKEVKQKKKGSSAKKFPNKLGKVREEEQTLQLNKQLMVVNEQLTVSSQLSETFEIRRDEIVKQHMTIDNLKIKYPTLFTKQHFADEFFRITGKMNIFQCVPKFLKDYNEKLYELVMTRKKLRSWVLSCKTIVEESDTEIAKEEFLLISLPVHFSEDQLLLTYPVSA